MVTPIDFPMEFTVNYFSVLFVSIIAVDQLLCYLFTKDGYKEAPLSYFTLRKPNSGNYNINVVNRIRIEKRNSFK